MNRFKVTVSRAEGDQAGRGEQREALGCREAFSCRSAEAALGCRSAEATLGCAPDAAAALSCGPDIPGLVAADREPGTQQALSPLTDK
jgi:hypothetical protein